MPLLTFFSPSLFIHLPHLILGVLRSVLEAAVEGCNVLTLCDLGDRLILEETSKVYKKEKEMKKGHSSIHLYFESSIYIGGKTCFHNYTYCISLPTVLAEFILEKRPRHFYNCL